MIQPDIAGKFLPLCPRLFSQHPEYRETGIYLGLSASDRIQGKTYLAFGFILD
jgi:hypothetical protein